MSHSDAPIHSINEVNALKQLLPLMRGGLCEFEVVEGAAAYVVKFPTAKVQATFSKKKFLTIFQAVVSYFARQLGDKCAEAFSAAPANSFRACALAAVGLSAARLELDPAYKVVRDLAADVEVKSAIVFEPLPVVLPRAKARRIRRKERVRAHVLLQQMDADFFAAPDLWAKLDTIRYDPHKLHKYGKNTRRGGGRRHESKHEAIARHPRHRAAWRRSASAWALDDM